MGKGDVGSRPEDDPRASRPDRVVVCTSSVKEVLVDEGRSRVDRDRKVYDDEVSGY